MLNYFIVPSYINLQDYKIDYQCPDYQKEELKCTQQCQNLEKKYLLLKKRYQQLEKENDSLKLQIDDLQANQSQIRKKKFKRRSQNQLSKDFKCKFQGCLKEYASQAALNLHMKMKHNAGTKKQRLVVIKQILEADRKGGLIPQIQINLPPNYQQEYEKALQQQNDRLLLNLQKQRTQNRKQKGLSTSI